ncbi:MAG TPA: hypothetical protein EYP58_05115 [bacterium (Candidatus Stahlbacteria)]|nr:hypothetical protein [Candidatus Stahlbacteria bacterium]
MTEQIHLWFPSIDLDFEFSLIGSLKIPEEDLLRALGTYYALKYLNLNISTLDSLRLGVMSDRETCAVYRKIMLQFGQQFRSLTKSYMKALLKIFLRRSKFDDFAIIGVGTKSDQDDIDVGIIDCGKNRKDLNQAITRLNIEMVKYASRLHFHLTEHVVERSFAANIDEFCALLDLEIHDFVIINEMLGAALILGNGSIFSEFKRMVTSRYYFEGGDIRYHEGYLRGILGEVRDLLAHPKSPESLRPKDDGLRVIKAVLYALKTIHRLEEVNAWQLLDRMINIDAKRIDLYQRLSRALSFFEIIRFLYQIFVSQEEDMPLEVENYQNLNRVADYMGYETLSITEPYQQMIIQYYQFFDEIRLAIGDVITSVTSHLSKHSRVLPLLRGDGGNKFEKFVVEVAFYRGAGFWDDVLALLEKDVGREFFASLQELPADKRDKLLTQFINYFLADVDNLLRVYLIIKEFGYDDLASSFLNLFLDQVKSCPDVKHRLVNIFNLFPDLINRFLTEIDIEYQKQFTLILEGEMAELNAEVQRKRLLVLTSIHGQSSNYFRLFFRRITRRYPEILRYLNKPARLEQFGQGVLAQLNSTDSYDRKIELLGDFYDNEFVRTALLALDGESPLTTNALYTGFSDFYLQLLFEVIGEALDERMFRVVKNRFAIYAAGGHGREQAFDDDYDLLIITDAEEPNLQFFTNQIVARMNRELTKRGVIPHFRLADFTGSYTISVKTLKSILEKEGGSKFIDQSQILGSRIIVGSVRMERLFERQIVDDYVFAQRQQYIRDMIREFNSRHETEVKTGKMSNNIKEGLGGLRDVEMFILICKAKTQIRDPITAKIFETLRSCLGDELFPDIKGDFLFLKNVRDLYRLTTAAVDEIESIGLERVGPIMGYRERVVLEAEICERRSRVYQGIKRAIKKIQIG